MSDGKTCCEKWSSCGLALLRVVVGLLFMQHGGQKLFNFPPAAPEHIFPLNNLLRTAAILELGGGALILLGLLTRPVAVILSGEMAVAYFMVHAKRGLWPANNGGEVAVLYCFVFLYFAMAGAGACSIDSLCCRGKPSSPPPA